MLFPVLGRCRITNAEGQKIVFGIDDEQTDMEVFDTQLAGEEIVTWRKQVPGSASFTLVAPSALLDRIRCDQAGKIFKH